MCEQGSVYMPCGPPCEQTCRNLGDDPEPYCEEMHCLEGCFCPPGMVKDGNLKLISLCFSFVVLLDDIITMCFV